MPNLVVPYRRIILPGGAGGRAITFVGAGTPSTGGTPGLPSGWQPGDLHVLFVLGNGNSGASASGYNSVSNATAAFGYDIWMLWRKAAGGDGAPTISVDNSIRTTIIAGFRGTDTSSPFESTAASNDIGATATYNTISALGPNRIVMQYMGSRFGIPSGSNTTGAGYTTGFVDDDGGATHFMDFVSLTSAGAAPSGSHTTTQPANGWARIATAIKPQ
jgi:hypothetical protein